MASSNPSPLVSGSAGCEAMWGWEMKEKPATKGGYKWIIMEYISYGISWIIMDNNGING